MNEKKLCPECEKSQLETPEYTDDFCNLLSEAYNYLSEQQKIMEESYGMGSYERWFYDSETGFLTFSDDGVDKLKIKYEKVGTLSKTSDTWLWAWANESILNTVKQEIVKVKTYGEEHNYEPLTKRKWNAVMEHGWEMTIISAFLLQSKGAYRVPTENSYSFMIFKEIIDLREKS